MHLYFIFRMEEIKIDKWIYIQLERLCTERETINIVKKQDECDKIFINHIPIKNLIFKLCKKLLELNRKKIPMEQFKIGLRI